MAGSTFMALNASSSALSPGESLSRYAGSSMASREISVSPSVSRRVSHASMSSPRLTMMSM